MYRVIWKIIAQQCGVNEESPDPTYRMTLISAVGCPLRALVINSGGSISDNLAAILQTDIT